MNLLLIVILSLLHASFTCGKRVDLDACRQAGSLAGLGAAHAACSVLARKCAAPDSIPRNIGIPEFPNYLFNEVLRGTCVTLFRTSCQSQAGDIAFGTNDYPTCTAILSAGPAFNGDDSECTNETEAFQIWSDVADEVCTQTLRRTVVNVAPPIQLQRADAGSDDDEVNEIEEKETEVTVTEDEDQEDPKPDEELVSGGRPTFQSTTAYSLDSSLAVDGRLWTKFGCTHTGYSDKKSDETSSNPWWSVDLGASRKLTRILIRNRGDCCGDRLSNFEIRVGNARPHGDGSFDASTQNPVCESGLSISTGKTEEYKCNLRGRYVTIRIPGDRKILTLCEVQVYAEVERRLVIQTETVLSQDKPTFQSSTLWNAVSSRAVDGNRNGLFKAKSCTQTGVSPTKEATHNPWWAVDLLASRRITGVRITNRSDCCEDRLRNFEIRVGNVKPSGSGWQNKVCASGQTIPRGETYYFECALTGRYVSVRIPGWGKILTLCEVEVLG